MSLVYLSYTLHFYTFLYMHICPVAFCFLSIVCHSVVGLVIACNGVCLLFLINTKVLVFLIVCESVFSDI